MSRFIVCTTINPPTEAIEKFDRIPGWKLIVVGDLKTPKNYKLKNGIYLDPGAQERIDRNLSDLIGWNCIQRRNFGFVYAYALGAQIIATVDDDNIPKSNWGKKIQLGRKIRVKTIGSTSGVVDPFFGTEHGRLWHRGFPIQLLHHRAETHFFDKKQSVVFDIQADFWDGSPDVDSVCRAVFNPDCTFSKANFPFTTSSLSPFNSQNTFLSRKVFPDYFLFPAIGRMDDIWASYYVQSKGFRVLYGAPTVVQKRNPHVLAEDFSKELIGFSDTLDFATLIKRNKSRTLKRFLPPSSLEAFQRYRKLFK